MATDRVISDAEWREAWAVVGGGGTYADDTARTEAAVRWLRTRWAREDALRTAELQVIEAAVAYREAWPRIKAGCGCEACRLLEAVAALEQLRQPEPAAEQTDTAGAGQDTPLGEG